MKKYIYYYSIFFFLIQNILNAQINIVQTAEIVSPTLRDNDAFGASVSINGEYAVIGAPERWTGNSGIVYVFQNTDSEWQLRAELTPSDGPSNSERTDEFGSSVAIFGNQIVIGAPSYGFDNGSPYGAVYVFEKPETGWINMHETVKINPPIGYDIERFGCSVAISQEVIVIGSMLHIEDEEIGAAFVYEKLESGWEKTASLLPTGEYHNMGFGRSVAISENQIVVGAYWNNNNQPSWGGRAFVFEKPISGWEDMNQTATLRASDEKNSDRFGYSVAISGNVIVVGAIRDDVDENGNDHKNGSAYIFEKPDGGWEDMTHKAKLTASDRNANDSFGASVAISDKLIVVGATGDDVDETDDDIYDGSVYIFEKPQSGWVNSNETYKIIPSKSNFNYFGSSVSISDNDIVIGDPDGNIEEKFVGFANIYRNIGRNDPPSFEIGSDPVVLEDDGNQVIFAWAFEIYDGDGVNQEITFNLSNDNNELFLKQPQIDSHTGDLTFTAADNAYGIANITVSLSDNGGTDHGGSDISDEKTFKITILPVNDPPEIAEIPDYDLCFGSSISINLNAFTSDIDNNVETDIQYSVDVTKAINGFEAIIDGATLILSNASFSSEIFQIIITANDQLGGVNSRSININTSYLKAVITNDRNVLTASEGDSYKWYKDGSEIVGENIQTITAHNVGNYMVEIAYQDNCIAVSEPFYVDNLTTIDFENITTQIDFYPNPLNDFLNISTDNKFNGQLEINIFDALGKIILSKKKFVNKIDVSSFPKGLYFLQIIYNNKSLLYKILKH